MAKSVINIRVLGDRQLQRQLKKFPLTIQKKVIAPETRKSIYRLQAHLLGNLAGGKVNIHTGSWFAAVDAQKAWALKRSRVRVGHGLNMPTRAEMGIPYDTDDNPYYPVHIEYGTEMRTPGGVLPEFRVMRDAVDDHYNDEVRQIAQGFHAGVKKQWAKLPKVA